MSNKISEKLLKYAAERGTDKTFCPSEIARDLFPEHWREKMDEVRSVADKLVLQNKLVVLQRGVIKEEMPSQLKGPIRLQGKSKKADS